MIDAAKLAWVRAKIAETRPGHALRPDTAKTLQILENVFGQLPPDSYNKPVLFLLDGVGNDVAAIAKQFDLIVVQASVLNVPDECRVLLKTAAKHFGVIVIDKTINSLSYTEKSNRLFSIARASEVDSRLPDLKDIVSALRYSNLTGFGILLDVHVPPPISAKLRNAWFLVAEITKSRQRHFSDNLIAELAMENNLVIMTGDKDFLNPELHDLRNLPGIIRVAEPNLLNTLDEEKRDVYINKVTDGMLDIAKSRTPANVKGKSIQFRIDGIAVVSGPPYRPNEHGFMMPTSKSARFCSL